MASRLHGVKPLPDVTPHFNWALRTNFDEISNESTSHMIFKNMHLKEYRAIHRIIVSGPE